MSAKLIDKLFKPPKPDKGLNAPRFQPIPAGRVHQADLLFLPNDKGFRYALVVVDVGSRMTDAEPLKGKESVNIVKALEKIYKRGVLKKPSKLEFDDGSEFKGATKKWCDNNGIIVRYAKPARHRQQAIVERRNQIIGVKLFKRMTEQELLTGETSVEWVDDLPNVIDDMNTRAKKMKPPKLTNEYQCEGDSCDILKVGTPVRVALDAPKDTVTGKRLNGKFRSTDVRWELKPRRVMQVSLTPNQPPLYLVNDNNDLLDRRQAYTKNQLQVISKNEIQPNSSAIRPINKNEYVVEKIVDKKKQKGKIFYLVKWKGYSSEENTWEPRTVLMEDVPHRVKEFEKAK